MSIQGIGSRSISFDPGSYGDTNQTVADVQHALNQLHRSSDVPENGVFDRTTEDAVREFQVSHGISGNGVINQETINALNSGVEQQERVEAREGTSAAGPATPQLSEADRNRRLQELRIQEPAVRQELEQRSMGPGGRVITDTAEPADASPRPQTHYEVTPHELGTERYRTAAEALHDPNPHRVNVNGHDFRISGASDAEARVIQNSLERLPASHLDRVPPNITVSDRLSNHRTSGGAQFPTDAESPRIELSRRSLQTAAGRESSGHTGNVNSTLLHEIGHCVGSGTYGNNSEAYRTAPYGQLHDLKADVPAGARDPASRRRIEQYAQAYMMYFGGSDRRMPGGLTDEQREAMRAHFEGAGIPANQESDETSRLLTTR